MLKFRVWNPYLNGITTSPNHNQLNIFNLPRYRFNCQILILSLWPNEAALLCLPYNSISIYDIYIYLFDHEVYRHTKNPHIIKLPDDRMSANIIYYWLLLWDINVYSLMADKHRLNISWLQVVQNYTKQT